MTSAQQTQYYTFLMRQRAKALYYHNLTQSNIKFIKDYIASGKDPRDNPEILKEFYLLINEFGTKIFESELGQLNLTFEDGTLKEKE